MFELYRANAGTLILAEAGSDFTRLRELAIGLSRIHGDPFYVVRQNFGDPIVFAYGGRVLSAAALIVELTKRAGKPVLVLQPPAAEQPPELPQPDPDEPPEPVEDDRPIHRRRRPSETKAAGPHEHKVFEATITGVDVTLGIIKAVVNVFGIRDDGDDVVHAGSFSKTLQERGGRVKVLNAHNTRRVEDVIGKPISMREIGRDELPAAVLSKYPEATGGLETETQYMISDPAVRVIFDRIANGFVTEYSIGFDIVDADFSKVTDAEGKQHTVRNIRQVRLWEYSPVIWGMNPATATVGVKSGDAEKEYTPDGPQRRLGDYLVAEISRVCGAMLSTFLADGYLSTDEHTEMIVLCNGATDTIKAGMAEDVALRPMTSMMDWLFFAQDGAAEAKAVLKQEVFDKIVEAATLLIDALDIRAAADEKQIGVGEEPTQQSAGEEPAQQDAGTGPQEPEEAPTSSEAGPLGDDAPSKQRSDLEFQLLKSLTELEVLDVQADS